MMNKIMSGIHDMPYLCLEFMIRNTYFYYLWCTICVYCPRYTILYGIHDIYCLCLIHNVSDWYPCYTIFMPGSRL